MRNSKYTREFRGSTVQLVINGDKSAIQVATDLDITLKLYTIGLGHIKKSIILKLTVEERFKSP